MFAVIWAWIVKEVWGYLLVGLGVAAVVGTIYTKGYVDGKANVQAKWDEAIKRSEANAEKARKDAERSVCTTLDCLRNSEWNRDSR